VSKFSFGNLNPIKRTGLSKNHTSREYFRNDPLAELANSSFDAQYSRDMATATGPYYAIVVKASNQLSSSAQIPADNPFRFMETIDAEELQIANVRIPELHAGILDPLKHPKNYESLASLHPQLVFKVEITDRLEVGDIVKVDFQNKVDFSGLILIEKVAKSSGVPIINGPSAAFSGGGAWQGMLGNNEDVYPEYGNLNKALTIPENLGYGERRIVPEGQRIPAIITTAFGEWKKNITKKNWERIIAYFIVASIIDKKEARNLALMEARTIGDNKTHWCGFFAGFCYAAAGLKPSIFKGTTWSALKLFNWSKNTARRIDDPKKLQMGDIVVVNAAPESHKYKKTGKHICVCVGVGSNYFESIEGNSVGPHPDGKSLYGVARHRRPFNTEEINKFRFHFGVRPLDEDYNK